MSGIIWLTVILGSLAGLALGYGLASMLNKSGDYAIESSYQAPRAS